MFKKLMPVIMLALLTACANTQDISNNSMSCCKKCECCKSGSCECCKNGMCSMEGKQCTMCFKEPAKIKRSK